MAHTLEELVELQRAVIAAHNRVTELRAAFGPPTGEPWTEAQTAAHETAWRAFRDLERDVQDAVTRFAKDGDLDRADVKRTVQFRASTPLEGNK
ncbi:hypothetical protein OG963_04645 [Streptomyces sp. NBC_01707]|uniref:hypothetical protein n=1 Tax=unclassified Streptomyces TaxID=2593676 RepID=UPI0029B1221C|nr:MULTISPECIES: hypothetical protein [unclassified Streptomyces]MDX3772109.1 hypothetical protein [Streptomyces sp. AK08-01B]MDX3821627.1 hypothetical protein [Streptomyces sp. AK08-01A]WSQ25083.1 hypothetical protein OG763_04165 [Streptomyces sp. NBC_01230]